MEVLLDIARFAASALILVIAFGICVSILATALRRPDGDRERIRVRNLNERRLALSDAVRGVFLGRRGMRRFRKERSKLADSKNPSGRLFVLDFDGDIAASAVQSLRNEVSTVLDVAGENDRVVVRLNSGGGSIVGYGLGASQLDRFRDAGISTTVVIDRIAASGGYMMACVADKVVAAPFSIIGSIGVVAMVPNVHRLLKEHGIDYHEFTAGKFKRTVSALAEITPEGKEKFIEQLNDAHVLFKRYVSDRRPSVDIEAVSTGEYWFGRQACELGLVDEIATSDEYLNTEMESCEVFNVSYSNEAGIIDRLPHAAGATADRFLDRLLNRLAGSRYAA